MYGATSFQGHFLVPRYGQNWQYNVPCYGKYFSTHYTLLLIVPRDTACSQTPLVLQVAVVALSLSAGTSHLDAFCNSNYHEYIHKQWSIAHKKYATDLLPAGGEGGGYHLAAKGKKFTSVKETFKCEHSLHRRTDTVQSQARTNLIEHQQ